MYWGQKSYSSRNWVRWVYILLPIRCVGVRPYINSHFVYLDHRRPVSLCSWCWPEAQVHLPGDQDLTTKGLVETAKIGIVQHLCTAHAPQTYDFLSDLGICTSPRAEN